MWPVGYLGDAPLIYGGERIKEVNAEKEEKTDEEAQLLHR